MKPSRTKKTKGLESIEKIIGRWLKANRVSQRLNRNSVFGKWKEVVAETAIGKMAAERTRAVDLTGGLLTVEVDSAPLLHELSTYYRQELLEELRRLEDFPNLRDIRFRAGTFEND